MRTNTPRINRFAQMIRFFRVSRLLLWTIWVMYRERRRVIRARAKGNYEVQPNVEILIDVLVNFRKTALKLGVLMIKLGQFLSTRADLLPERALEALSSLQDEVPPAPFSHIVSSIETELGKPVEEVFSLLERKATAAASLGQVHKATLKSTGQTVAVKVQRPNVDQLVGMDLSTLRFVIWVINRFVDTGEFIDLWGFYREFERTVFEEVDYVREATNSQRFKEMFKDDTTIYIPTIYDQYTTKHIIVMEWIDGIKLNDYPALEAGHFDRLEVATRMVKAYFYQFFNQGFFHADPHPGNIFVKTSSSPDNPIIAFVDFGMVGSLNRTMKKGITDLFLAFIGRNSHGLVQALVKLGFIGSNANLTVIERGIELMMQQYYGISLSQARDLDVPDVASEVEQLMYGQPFQIPSQFAFTGRAIGTLVGVATGLAPDFNFVNVATPYARQFLGLDSDNAGQTFQDLATQLLESGRVLLTLPSSVERVISRLDSGQIEVRLADPLPTRGRRNGRGRGRNPVQSVANATEGIPWALMFASSMAGGVFLNSNRKEKTSWFCFGLAGASFLGLLFKRQ